MANDSPTGLLVLHGNRLELLAETVFGWLAAHPLAPLEQETVLVQSNGMAEWFKMALAARQGICAATTVELPARFVWRAYRAVLGRQEVPATSPLDKLPLTWRLMHLLPGLALQPGFEPVAAFLGERPGDGAEGGSGEGNATRRLQLAQRLADLFDQYQVYRSDWLENWAAGDDVLRTGRRSGAADQHALADDQRWQPALWRALRDTLAPEERDSSRARLHQRFVERLQRTPAAEVGHPAAVRPFPALPRRVVLFGTTHIPHQTLEAIAALAGHCQVLMAVPNPCRFHWADTIDGRELLRFDRHRHALREGRDLSAVPLEDMHAHGHPLLSAWGRQSRDFVRQLDAFDDAQAAQRRFALPRVDLFDDEPGGTLLEQVQAAVRDLLPLSEHPRQSIGADDRSIVFHVAHSAQREVEILHDQLLRLLADPPGDDVLHPRDIVVMVPDIDRFAPAIRSVFGQYPRSDARHIPWGIADQQDRGHQPLLVALEMLLRAPQARFGASDVRGLLDVPALAARFGIGPEDLPTLVDWIDGAGVRWGLNAEHRAHLGLGASGEQNTWAFGLRRMLLGYATGELPDGEGYAGIEPYAEVAGLDAGLAGALAELLRTLTVWWQDALQPRAPQAWADRLRNLIADLFKATDDTERAAVAALGDALSSWLQACETAAFDEPLDLAVVREAWLDTVDEPRVSQRFKAGGVTFCTLLPLRAIPFDVVCLLGMNDGDYPRRGSRIDFDLMALPGQARPGDRSRRDDDRQLMLDALLSARRVLYVSWAGRSVRDNEEQPPSVLVAQLRDYLASGFGADVPTQRTTEHPLQPFSRRYFEPAAPGDAAPLFTYAAEWRAAHRDATPSPAASTVVDVLGRAADTAPLLLDTATLAAFLANPVKAFFERRLRVRFGGIEAANEDDEAFGHGGLERWAAIDTLLRNGRGVADLSTPGAPPAPPANWLSQQVARLARAGQLPMAGPGAVAAQALGQAVEPVLDAWRSALADWPVPRDAVTLRVVDPEDPTLVFDDLLTGLRSAEDGSSLVWIELIPNRPVGKPKSKSARTPRPERLLAAWVRGLAAAACGHPVGGVLIGEGAVLRWPPTAADTALPVLLDLMRACRDGFFGAQPLPTAVRTGLALLDDRDGGQAETRKVFEGAFRGSPGEGREACLARLFPDYAALKADPGFEPASQRLYGDYRRWLKSQHLQLSLLSSSDTADAADND